MPSRKHVLIFTSVVLISALLAACRPQIADTVLSSGDVPTAVIVLDAPTAAPTDIPLTVDYEIIPTHQITVYDHKAGACVQMDLEEYVLGVVAGEMPVSFAFEALKAQTVATRTYSVYGILHGACGTCEEADVCTNSQCCQAYASVDALKERWGSEFDANYGKLSRAVAETASLVMRYDGEVIDALYHGSSAGGYTEDSKNVFSSALPYLRSVPSDSEIGSRQTGEVRVALEEFVRLANEAYPDAALTVATVPADVAVTNVYPSGRVESVRIGGASITGKQMRKLMGLDSAWFTLSFTKTEVVFSTKGFGHGVGMSQAGANGMAQAGASCEQILHHYYSDVTISEYTAPAAP